MPQFEFVTISDPREAKKHSTKVRRHVMKDIGKARRKVKTGAKETTTKRKSAADQTEQANRDIVPMRAGRRPIQVSIGHERDMSSRAARAPVISPWAESLLSQMVYPIEMNEAKLELVRFMVEEARYVYRPFRFLWLGLSVTNEAAWYITLANSAAWRAGDWGAMVKDIQGNPEALSYYSKSLNRIGERLKDVSDDGDLEGLIVAIAGCICHDATMGNFDRVNVHLQGLKRMIDKKGGMSQLSIPLLPLAIAWLDLNAATFRNDAPYFPAPNSTALLIEDVGDESKYLNALLERWDHQCPSLGDIQSAILATAKVAVHVNKHNEKPGFWRDDLNLARMLSPASHEILTLPGRPLPDDFLDPDYSGVAAREAFRCAALIFLADVKRRFNAPVWELPRHLNAFRQISRLPMVDWAAVPELNMWAHVVAALVDEEADDEDRSWHIDVIVGIMGMIDCRSAADGLDIARGVIWIDNLMNERAAKLELDIDARLRSRKDLPERKAQKPTESAPPKTTEVDSE